jgi:hypothetical protein
MRLLNFISLRLGFLLAACFLGVSSLMSAQEATDVQPSAANRLRLNTRPQDPADASAANLSSGGGDQQMSSVTATGLKLVDIEVGYAFGVGAPDFDYGAEITPPLVNLNDDPLTLEEARDYWREEPLRPGELIQIDNALVTPLDADFNERYYYSPHSELIYGSQTGGLSLTWVTAIPDQAGNYGTLPQNYTVGFGTNLTARQVYWSEVDYKAPRVQIPTGIVQGIKILYNDRMPSTVREDNPTTPEVEVDDRVIPFGVDPSTVPNETVWYDSTLEMIRAYNLEGRVLIEYLGDARPGTVAGAREHLGMEILEVKSELPAITATTMIGKQILPANAPPDVLDDRDFSAVAVAPPGPPIAQHFIENRSVYYAIEENRNAANAEFYWLEEGEHAILWPKIRNYYLIEWPEDGDFDSYFARPNSGASDDIVAGSFIDLISTNSPELIYQDDPEADEAGVDSRFHLSVALQDDRNRALIRLSSGNEFWYVRLYSGTTDHLLTLDPNSTNFDPESNPLDFRFSQSVEVGQRLEPPHSSLELGGYVDPALGNAYQADVYVDPFADGGIAAANEAAIIPVNALPGNDTLRVWWFKKLSPPVALANLFQGVFVPTVVGDYTISYPVSAPQIVMASNSGTGDLLTEEAGGRIYFQNNPDDPGYNPNEEHALKVASRAYALRDDLNLVTSSEPFVLLAYPDADGRPDMTVFEVLRENDTYKFDYDAVAGRLLQAPFPLPVISQPIVDGVSRNIEVTPTNLDAVIGGAAAENLTHYDQFTFQDRKGSTWVYRGLHDGEENTAKKLLMQYYYPVQAGFWFPELSEQPEVGTIVPYLRPLGSTESPITGTPLTISFTPQWPESTPILHFGETLAKAKFGLPQIYGQTSAQILYQQSIAQAFDAEKRSVVLHDSTINRTSDLSEVGLDKLPATVRSNTSRGKVYFQGLPSHLEQRIFFDGLIGVTGALVFQGTFVDELAGEDYVLLNTLSDSDVETLKSLCEPLSVDEDKTKWDNLIDGLKVVPSYRAYDNRFIEESLTLDEWLDRQPYDEILGQEIQAEYGPTELPEVASPDQAVNGYFLSAIGGGAGYVTLVTGNGLLNSPSEEPVQVHVFRVGEKLYQGELKPLVAGNPLSENVTVLHTGDFAADPESYEFQWRKAPPENGLAPQVFSFSFETVDFDLRNRKLYRGGSATPSETIADGNPFPNVAIYHGDDDRSVPGLRLTGTIPPTDIFGTELGLTENVYFSLNLGNQDGAIVTVNGVEVIRYQALEGDNSEVASSVPDDLSPDLLPSNDYLAFALPSRSFRKDSVNEVEIFYNTTKDDDDNSFLDFRVGVVRQNDISAINYPSLVSDAETNYYVVSGSGVDTLGDNYFIMRYRPVGSNDAWSKWTNPGLVEGWIKRVLAGINPFNQRVSGFFENSVDTNTSIVASAGSRWEGDIALNLDAVQDLGLIEIYETVLKRGINLSINGTPAVDYAPANDALLLAAGYLNDLYMALGNEAFADAANPTVSFDGQALGTLGDAAVTASFEENFRSTSTARFAFQGQVATLLDEELALLRGRDDSLSPSIQTPPVYNRMFWNYTRGIDAGELVYALNYNIRELNDEVADGRVDASDAARMFPQAHGDSYGHYLTAVKNYYRLLTDPEFTWGTRIEAVNILGQPVSVDYFDERKFAAGADALTRTVNQIVSLERRKAFQEAGEGWGNLSDGKTNIRTNTKRYWGVDEWAARGAQGAYFHWVVGNAIVPAEDNVNEGIQKIDRSTVPELDAIAKASENIQKQLEAADARVNPLDLSEDSILFDISPSELADGKTHFEQVYERAVAALKNANSVFKRAGDSTRLLRSLENQSQNLTQIVDDEETAFVAELIDIFGTPYPGDIGPGKFYPQDYVGPDLIRYMAISRPFDVFTKDSLFGSAQANSSKTFTVLVNDKSLVNSFNNPAVFLGLEDKAKESATVSYTLNTDSGPYLLAESDWGRRSSNGSLQGRLAEVRLAEEQLYVGLNSMNFARETLFTILKKFEADMGSRTTQQNAKLVFENVKFYYKEALVAFKTLEDANEAKARTIEDTSEVSIESTPKVVGTATDATAPARGAILSGTIVTKTVITAADIARAKAEAAADFKFLVAEKALNTLTAVLEETDYLRGKAVELQTLYRESRSKTREVDALRVAYTRALESYQTELSNGETVLTNREVFRRRAAAAVQGYRTRDLAFRTFRTEALQEYQTLLDWASKYAFLAAQAYDYETGLLGSTDGQRFIGDIVSARALGIIGDDGLPTISASSVGDAGLSGLLAKMKGDYDVVKGRLGFNNPETNGTTFSLRREYFRIPNGPEGDLAWQQKLESLVTKNLLSDADIAAHAMQLGGQDVAAQPGFLITFPTTIEDGRNFFGLDYQALDSNYTPTNFATKIHSAGVVFEGYQGMAPCLICQGGPGDGEDHPDHNHDDDLGATPYVYLIPSGLDTMRTPPLGDGQGLRSWSVQDYAMPLPFDLGSLEPSNEAVQQNTNSLRTNFRSPRRHPAFRATNREDFFYTDFADDYTSSRLVGRSAWNSNWKLVIPAKGLLADEQEGIARFIRSVKDIKLHLKTYSYSGN